MQRLMTFRAISAVVVALAVPLVIYLVNGTVEPWAFLLGAVIGVAWYFLPFIPAL
jgi:hypothetical protein